MKDFDGNKKGGVDFIVQHRQKDNTATVSNTLLD
jgi:hypothetical protein